MLRKVKTVKIRANGWRFAIVASRYNARYVDGMLQAAKKELKRAGAKHIEVVRVPGAYEIPVVAAQLARRNLGQASLTKRSKQIHAIICLGVILRGETVHAAHIGEAVSHALMQIQLETGVPVVHEVLLLENAHQAEVRCLGRKHNRGTEAAQTALSMAGVMAKVRSICSQ